MTPEPTTGSRPAFAGLASNAIANYAGQFATLGIGFLLTPFLLSSMGPAGYGIWALIVSLQGLGALLDVGIGSSVVKFVAQHEARGEADERNRVLSTTFLLHIAIGFVAFALLAAASVVILPLLELTASERAEAQAALLVAAAGLALTLPLSVPGNLLTGLRRFEMSNAINIVQAIGSAVAILAALAAGAGPAGVIAISCAASAAGYLAKWFMASRVLPDLRISPRLAGRSTLRRVGGYSVWLFLVDAGTTLFYNADSVLIAAFLPVGAVGVYNLGFKPASAVSYLAGPLASVFVPAASALEARDNLAAVRRLLVDGTRTAIALTLVGSVWLWAFGGQLLQLWVGPGHADSLPVLWIFVGVFLVGSYQNPSAAILRGVGRVRAFALVVLGEYVVNVVLSLVLIPQLGIAGAALATLIPALVNCLVIIPLLACRAVGVNFRTFVARTLPGATMAGAVTLMVLVPISLSMPSASLVGVIVGGIAAIAVFGASFFALGMGGAERMAILGTARSALLTVLTPARNAFRGHG